MICSPGEGVIHGAEYDSEVKKYNGDRPGLENFKGIYSEEMPYFVETQ